MTSAPAGYRFPTKSVNNLDPSADDERDNAFIALGFRSEHEANTGEREQTDSGEKGL